MNPIASLIAGTLIIRGATVLIALAWALKLRDIILALLGVIALGLWWRVLSLWMRHEELWLLQDAVFAVGVSAVQLAIVLLAGRVLSHRNQVLRLLEQSEERSQRTLENISDAVFMTDDRGFFTHVWSNVQHVFGYAPGEVRNMRGLNELFGEPISQHVTQSNFTELRNHETTIRNKGGEQRTVLVNAKPTDIDGASVLFTCRDITERRANQMALESALAEVRELKEQLEAENAYLQEEIKLNHNFEEIVGGGASLHDVLSKIEQVAPMDTTVLILGETGVGKELFARAVHNLSRRRDRPLVKVNCASLPGTLIESELFGHERGAFTGAVARRIGRFELADGATIFLDEIGDLPLEIQAKLLRVLQEREFERLGNPRTMRVDVRLIAATNRDLLRDVDEGRFRSDLYFRLNVFPITIPPLRERMEDVPHLAKFFLQKYAAKVGKRMEGFSAGSLRRLMAYSWPGNVRELENVIERAVVSTTGTTARVGNFDGRAAAMTQTTPNGPLSLRLEEVERDHIRRVLDDTGWVVQGENGAASRLGLNPSTLRSRMKKLNIVRQGSPLDRAISHPPRHTATPR